MEKGLTFKQMILNDVANQPRGYMSELADIAGFTGNSKGANFKKVLIDESKEFEKFTSIVNVARQLYKENEQKMVEKYSREISPNKQTARIMLEYLCNNRLLDSMKDLIEKMSQCDNKESREWAKVYNVNLNYQLNYHTLNVNDYLDDIRDCKTTIPELKIYLKILRCHGLYMKKAHSIAFELSHDIINEIDEINDEYLKDVYETKLNEILSYIHLRVRNNPIEARKYALKVLDSYIGMTHKAFANYTLGCSYLFESYEKSKENFAKSIEIYKKIKRDQAATDVEEISELLDIVWDKEIINIKYSETYRNYWILKNKLNFSVELNEDEIDKPWYFLLKGMKDNNTDILMQSLIHFVKRGDTFFANLSKLELKRMNYNQGFIDELIRFYEA